MLQSEINVACQAMKAKRVGKNELVKAHDYGYRLAESNSALMVRTALEAMEREVLQEKESADRYLEELKGVELAARSANVQARKSHTDLLAQYFDFDTSEDPSQ